jgi:hypothetical protein
MIKAIVFASTFDQAFASTIVCRPNQYGLFLGEENYDIYFLAVVFSCKFEPWM